MAVESFLLLFPETFMAEWKKRASALRKISTVAAACRDVTTEVNKLREDFVGLKQCLAELGDAYAFPFAHIANIRTQVLSKLPLKTDRDVEYVLSDDYQR